MFVRAKKKRLRSSSKKWIPHKYQLRAIARGTVQKYLAYFLDPGLGKTSIILMLFKMLQAAGLVKALLVVAPLRPCYLVWPKEVKKWRNFNDLSICVLHNEWKIKKEVAIKQQHDIYVINPEGLPWLKAQLKGKHKNKWPFDMLVVDESTKFKNMSSNRFKNLKGMLGKFSRRYILTGTPIPNGLDNIQGQVAIVDMGETFGITKCSFHDNYFKQVGRPEWGQWIPKNDERAEALYKKVAPFAMRMKGSDYLELPERVDNIIKIKLPRKARKHYDEVESDLFTMIDNKDLNASTSGVAAMKCHQIANGSIYEDDDPINPQFKNNDNRPFHIIHTAKLDALEDLVEELDGKPLLVGFKFKHDWKQLKKRFKKDIVTLGKGTTMKEAMKIEKQFNQGKIKILAAYPGTAALGLNLQEICNNVCWYSLLHDWEAYDQFIKRVERQGNLNTHTMNHILMAEDTVDEGIYRSVTAKGATEETFLKAMVKYRHLKLVNK